MEEIRTNKMIKIIKSGSLDKMCQHPNIVNLRNEQFRGAYEGRIEEIHIYNKMAQNNIAKKCIYD